MCIAKTQYSFTQDAGISGAPENFEINFKELIVNRGAGFLVAVAGEMLRMPGLPKIPQATKIKIENGEITGLL
ncbi:MAG: formate--tetrahydrofolate ligase [Leptospiraceae bacterium]|nr:formate--tetrahydrofolate ligase [Leptospiraceae bacterium]